MNKTKTYFEYWTEFWLPIYKRQVFKAKFNKDEKALNSIKENINKNIHFSSSEKREILEELKI